jgi:hypothetical protein
MKQFILQTDHQGIPANTKLTGPTLIPGSNTYGYYPEGSAPESKFCFFQNYVESQPTLFQEVKTPDKPAGGSVN